jgi:hypothetical protein
MQSNSTFDNRHGGALVAADDMPVRLSPCRQRMGGEGAVDGEEPQALDLTLREQHPIERVAGDRLGLDGHKGVAFVDRDHLDPQAVKKLGEGMRPTVRLSLPNLDLMRFPIGSPRVARLEPSAPVASPAVIESCAPVDREKAAANGRSYPPRRATIL